MDGAKFDRLARALSTILTRRGLVAMLGGFTGVAGWRAALASQLGPATCGVQGTICTLVVGCCDGFTCVTSAINTSFGICVPGEGGMVSTGTTLISPFSEGAVEEATARLQDAASASTTDPLPEQDAPVEEITTSSDATLSARNKRSASKRSSKPSHKDKPNPRPRLRVELRFDEADGDSEMPEDQMVPIEVVRVTNRSDVTVLLTRIETIPGDIGRSDLTTSQFTLGPTKSYSFVSGLPTEDAEDADNSHFQWLSNTICNDQVNGQGYRLMAALSLGTKNYGFTILCDKARGAGGVVTASDPPRKRKRNDQQQKKKR